MPTPAKGAYQVEIRDHPRTGKPHYVLVDHEGALVAVGLLAHGGGQADVSHLIFHPRRSSDGWSEND